MDIRFLIPALMVLSALSRDRKNKVWLIEESTMANQEIKAYPENGRGMPFAVSDTLVVAADGTGDYRTVQAALDAVPVGNQKEAVIYIKNGVYSGKLHLDSTRPHVTMIGEDEDHTILTWSDHPGMVLPNGDSVNTRNSHSF